MVDPNLLKRKPRKDTKTPFDPDGYKKVGRGFDKVTANGGRSENTERTTKPRSVSDDTSRTHGLKPAQHNLILRYQKAMRYRIAGNAYSEIAELMRNDPDVIVSPKYDGRAAYFDVQGYLNELRSTVQDNLIDLIDVESQRLDALTAAFWDGAMNGDPRAGRMVLDIMERRAKMLGLDEAIKVDWRIELRQIERSGVLSDEEIREHLGDDLYSMYRQFSEERFAESENPMSNFLVDKVNKKSYPKQGEAEFGEFIAVAEAVAEAGAIE